jgi:predicted RND superfamily exporter protein
VIDRFFDRFYGVAERRQRMVLVILGLGLVASTAAATRIQLDMSFRPLFSESDDVARETEAFEARFGQPSGAYLVAILRHEPLTDTRFLREVAALSDEVAEIPDVTEVLSLPRLPIVTWEGDTPQVLPHIPDAVLTLPEVPPDVAALAEDPRLRRTFVSVSGDRTLLLARVDLPLEDLDARKPVIREFRRVVDGPLRPAATDVRVTGVSVVEEKYADMMLRSLFLNTGLVVTVIAVLLFIYFRRLKDVITCMAGVNLAIPVVLAAMVALDLRITIVNSQVLTMVLIVGVTQAIHMVEEFYRRKEAGTRHGVAVRSMFVTLGLACLMTSVVTIVAFLALRTANIRAIRDFGLSVAVGLAFVYVINLIVVPALLRQFHQGETAARGPATLTRAVLSWTARTVSTRAVAVTATCLAVVAVMAAAGASRLDVDQRFNEELRPGHPIRDDEMLLEREFGGFLGPELWIAGDRPGALTDPENMQRLSRMVDQLRALPEVLTVTSFLDHLPAGLSGDGALRGLQRLRADPSHQPLLDELIDANAREAAVIVRTTDMGTDRANTFVDDIERLGRETLGDRTRMRVVGQWLMAQRGMQNLLTDMLTSVVTAALLVLPLVALTVRRRRLFLASILPTVAPVVAALGFMGLTGTTVRVGTAMILAIALGLAVDDTIHLLVRIRQREDRGESRMAAVRETLLRNGRPCSFSSYILIAGFLTMFTGELRAIRDMGMVAAFVLALALVADLLLCPAILLLRRRDREVDVPVAAKALAAVGEGATP